ncbi:hypothetical protein NOCARDAX2BIS_200053 [Nocardioides sp. AX2bis]|nr:hypothetical protein NOCARDAX2BIS_200053 [Nocardioides sp. AX2bis]
MPPSSAPPAVPSENAAQELRPRLARATVARTGRVRRRPGFMTTILTRSENDCQNSSLVESGLGWLRARRHPLPRPRRRGAGVPARPRPGPPGALRAAGLPRRHRGPQRRRPRPVGADHALGARRGLPSCAVVLRREAARRPGARSGARRAERLRGRRARHRAQRGVRAVVRLSASRPAAGRP